MKTTFLSKRLVFQSVDKAPPSPENFSNKEKQSSAAEVASQTPSQIFNDTVRAGSAITAKYSQGTSALASLVANDPIFTGQGIIPSTLNPTSATKSTSTTTKTNAKQKN